jgi:hypothetical protein
MMVVMILFEIKMLDFLAILLINQIFLNLSNCLISSLISRSSIGCTANRDPTVVPIIPKKTCVESLV